MRNRTAPTLLIAALLLALPGCGSTESANLDPAAKADERQGTASTSPAAPNQTAPLMATGPLVTMKPFTYRVPKGWTKPAYNYGRLAVNSHSPDSLHTIRSVYFRDIVETDTPIEQFARDSLRAARQDGTHVKRLSNVTVDGIEMYRFETHLNYGTPIRSIEYGTGAGRYLTRLYIETWTDYLTKAEERRIHESVLNTIRWRL